jgi:DNA polymerase I
MRTLQCAGTRDSKHLEHLCYSALMSDGGVQLGLFSPADVRPAHAASVPTLATLINSDAAFVALLETLRRAERIAFDTETTGVDMTRCELVGIAFCVQAGAACYVPVEMTDAPMPQWALRPGSAQWQALAHALLHSTAELVAHNAKYDLGVLKRAGLSLPVERIVYDTMIALFLLSPLKRGSAGLKAAAAELLGWQMTEIHELIGDGRHQISMRDVPIDLITPYACADADATFRLRDAVESRLGALHLQRLFREVELPLIPVLTDMELLGVAIDVPHLNGLAHEIAARMRALEADIYKSAGRVFNVGSSQQLGKVLYQTLGLPVKLSDDDRNPSTRAHTLDNLKDLHPIVPLVMTHRELAKLFGTYADALPRLINPHTGRVHTSFNQAVVVTGRLSSTGPNLQNIPITSEMGRRVRAGFIAREAGSVLSADYSQVELRLLAHLADDGVLRAAFQRGEDIHMSTAAAIYNVELSAVTAEQRAFAKRINFGICYGMGAYSLARSTGMTEQDAERFIAQYFKRFSRVKAWLDATKRKMAAAGYVDTLYGRRRPFQDMRDRTPAERKRAERLAINHPVQGTAADVIKLAMIKLHRKLLAGGYASRMTLQVHDELVLDVAAGEAEAVAALVRTEMEDAAPLSVPLGVEIGIGPNWNDVR